MAMPCYVCTDTGLQGSAKITSQAVWAVFTQVDGVRPQGQTHKFQGLAPVCTSSAHLPPQHPVRVSRQEVPLSKTYSPIRIYTVLK